MGKLIALFTLLFLLVGSTVLAGTPDLTGTWDIDSSCMRIGDEPAFNDLFSGEVLDEPHQMVITWQSGEYFKGYACDAELPNGILVGVIEGKKVYMTTWDSINLGSLNNTGTVIEFISQNQLDNPPNAPETCKGTATKINPGILCYPQLAE